MKPVHHAKYPDRPALRPGSAMILVVVLTVLLSLIGLMFILAARIEQATSLSANVDRDLSAGVDSVVNRVNKVLVDDLFGFDHKAGLCDGSSSKRVSLPIGLQLTIFYNESFDYAGDQDPWLSPLGVEIQESGQRDNVREHKVDWAHLSDLYYDVLGVNMKGFPGLSGAEKALTIGRDLKNPDGSPQVALTDLFPADADGDGVWDSIWVKLPNISSAKGEPLYSALRIVDNCGMLNLNTAYRLKSDSEGQYLSGVDYERFLRGRDRDAIGMTHGPTDLDLTDPNTIRRARMVSRTPPLTLDTVPQYHGNVIMKIDKPDPLRYRLFDLSDELEIRNRLLLTTSFEARFERPDITHYTFDADGGLYAVKMIPFNDDEDNGSPFTVGTNTYYRTSFDGWKIRMNPANFDDKSGAYFDPSEYPDPKEEDKRKLDFRWKYDRRHVCTFYSFDRNIRSGPDLVLDPIVQSLEKDASQLSLLNSMRSVFWPANGSVVSSRDIVIANTPESRKAILQLLYALRAYYLRWGNPGLTEADIQADLKDTKHPRQLLSKAARKAAQTVANMIDYLDDTSTTLGPFGRPNSDPTFIDEALVRRLILDASNNAIDPTTDTRFAFGLGSHVVYGYERQPFISELYCTFSKDGIGQFGIEFVNPYDQDIRLEGWRVVVGDPKKTPRTFTFAASNSTVPKGTTTAPGRFVLRNSAWGTLPNDTPTCEWNQLAGGSNGFITHDVILLQRPIPDGTGGKTWLTVDSTGNGQITPLLTDGTHASKRDDRAWKFTRANEFFQDDSPTLGSANNITIPSGKKAYQMPVADNNTTTVSKPIATLGDFEKILTIGSEWITAADPNAITFFAGLASNEGELRTDIVSAPEILRYVGFLNRPSGNLPGRININTATREVIQAAIPPSPSFVKNGEDPQKFADDLAGVIVRTGQAAAFKSIADLITPGKNATYATLLTKWKDDPADNVGDPSMTDDIEERDWILSRLSNIFTVRSDTFTAYIAVRIGAPRVAIDTTRPSNSVVDVDADRRYIAIFDRSAVDQPNKTPRLVALHPVPEAR